MILSKKVNAPTVSPAEQAEFDRQCLQVAVQSLIDRVERDPALKVGQLPWKMSKDEWKIFKVFPELFRKQRHVEEEEFWLDMKDWAAGTGKYAR